MGSRAIRAAVVAACAAVATAVLPGVARADFTLDGCGTPTVTINVSNQGNPNTTVVRGAAGELLVDEQGCGTVDATHNIEITGDGGEVFIDLGGGPFTNADGDIKFHFTRVADGGDTDLMILGSSGPDAIIVGSSGVNLDGTDSDADLTWGVMPSNWAARQGLRTARIEGRGGNDTISLLGGHGAGSVWNKNPFAISGGPGNDRLESTVPPGSPKPHVWPYQFTWAASATPVTVNLAGGFATGEGTDTLVNARSVIGSPHADIFIGTPAADYLIGDSGADVLHGGGANDVLEGNSGGDHLFGDAGDDALLPSGGTDDGDVSDGGTGLNTLVTSVVFATQGGANVDLGSGAVSGSEGHDTVANVQWVKGTPRADWLKGGPGNDTLEANGAALPGSYDVVVGYGGSDVLVSGGGVTYLLGGAGNDILRNGFAGGDITAHDVYAGGDGVDWVDYATNPLGLPYDIDLSTSPGTADAANQYSTFHDDLYDIENVAGSPYDDMIVGSAAANVLAGVGGNDTISGRDGNDGLYGGPGNDSLDGGAGSDTCVQGLGSGTVTNCP